MSFLAYKEGLLSPNFAALFGGLLLGAIAIAALEVVTQTGALLASPMQKFFALPMDSMPKNTAECSAKLLKIRKDGIPTPSIFLIGGSSLEALFIKAINLGETKFASKQGVDYTLQPLTLFGSNPITLNIIADTFPNGNHIAVIGINRILLMHSPNKLFAQGQDFPIGHTPSLQPLLAETKYTGVGLKWAWPRSLSFFYRSFVSYLTFTIPFKEEKQTFDNLAWFFVKTYGESNFDEMFDWNKKAVKKAIETLTRKGFKVIVYDLPVRSQLASYRPDQADKYKSFIRELSQRSDVNLIDLAIRRNFSDQEYSDLLHLNDQRAYELMPAFKARVFEIANHRDLP